VKSCAGVRAVFRLTVLVMTAVLAILILYCAPVSRCPECKDAGNRKGLAVHCELCGGDGRVSLRYKWTEGC
jgi:hypothetical protein